MVSIGIYTLGGEFVIVVYTRKNAWKNNEFTFYPQYFLGAFNSSTFSTFWVRDIDVPTTVCC